MEIAELLHSLNLAGLSLDTEPDGRLSVIGPVDTLTTEQQYALKEHKQPLLNMLTTTCLTIEQREREAIKFADSDEAVEPLSECLKYFDTLMRESKLFGGDAHKQSFFIDHGPACERCQSTQSFCSIIHAGESLRRDCAKCGRFIEFPTWHNPKGTKELLPLTEYPTTKASETDAATSETL